MAGVKGRSGGSNRKSAAEHELYGTYRRSRHAPLLLEPMPAPPSHDAPPPRTLSIVAKQTWRGIVAQYDGWSLPDLLLLEAALRALDESAAFQRLIERQGLVLRGPRGGERAHPLLAARRRAEMFALTVFKQLGLGGDRP